MNGFVDACAIVETCALRRGSVCIVHDDMGCCGSVRTARSLAKFTVKNHATNKALSLFVRIMLPSAALRYVLPCALMTLCRPRAPNSCSSSDSDSISPNM